MTTATLNHTTLAAALRRGAAAIPTEHAAIDLLLAHGTWMLRPDFLDEFVDGGNTPTDDGAPMALIDFTALHDALNSGVFDTDHPADQLVLHIAASITTGRPVTLRALSTCDEPTTRRVLAALAHTAGYPHLPTT